MGMPICLLNLVEDRKISIQKRAYEGPGLMKKEKKWVLRSLLAVEKAFNFLA